MNRLALGVFLLTTLSVSINSNLCEAQLIRRRDASNAYFAALGNDRNDFVTQSRPSCTCQPKSASARSSDQAKNSKQRAMPRLEVVVDKKTGRAYYRRVSSLETTASGTPPNTPRPNQFDLARQSTRRRPVAGSQPASDGFRVIQPASAIAPTAPASAPILAAPDPPTLTSAPTKTVVELQADIAKPPSRKHQKAPQASEAKGTFSVLELNQSFKN